MRGSLSLISTLIMILFTASLQARIIHVPSDSSTIQGGINGAVDGDTVMVLPGTYYEHDIDFLGKAIVVTGTAPDDSAVVAATVVDADSSGRVFIFHSGEDTTSILSGLSVTNGLADTGGGIYCTNSSPLISHCMITRNSTYYAGGGINCENSSPNISKNLIVGNSVDFGDGGGISCGYSSNPLIYNNIINGNSAGAGGGIYIHAQSSPIVNNNIIAYNQSIDVVPPHFAAGAGISVGLASATIINNTITQNYSSNYGGGIYLQQNNNTIVVNTILWGNSAPLGPEIALRDFSGPGATLTISYSDVEGGQGSVYMESMSTLYWGQGMIDSDPLFADSGYHLQSNSPCIDTGDPSILDACLPPGLSEDRSDMGAYGGEENCGWPVIVPGVDLSLYPTGPTTVPIGEFLDFHTYIFNNMDRTVSGDYWLSVQLPNSTEFLIPEILLNYSNPLSGQIQPFGSVDLDNWLFIPGRADTGSYRLIGRIGDYPDTITDEESFEFQVVE